VRVYQYSPDTTPKWTQLGEDIDGEAHSDYSGYSVSLSSDGTILAIGAIMNDDNGQNSGHTRVYQYVGNTWTQLGGDIDGEAASDYSGASVSLSSDGTILAIGAYNNDGTATNAGHVRVYQYSNNAWAQLGSDIDGEAKDDSSGRSISLSSDGTIVAIGGSLNGGTGSQAGHVRVYQYANSAWSQLGSDIDGEAASDRSGSSVSISSDGMMVAIGAIYNDGTGSNAGHVRVYQYSNNAWAQVGQDLDGEAAGDESGTAVSLSADGYTVVIGALKNDGTDSGAGHVRVYRFPKQPCTENQHVSAGTCTACVEGKTRAAGDNPSGGDTACDLTLCQENHHVVNHACQPCALGTRPAGDDTSGDDTQCEVGPCGGLTCVRGTCVNDVCQCPVGYGGMTCNKDMTASGQLQFLESRRKSIPSKQDIKNIQNDVKSFIKDTLKKALLTKSVKEAVKETKMAIEERDLNDRAKLAVLQLKKQPVIALSTENKDTQDDCLQSDCAHVDIKDSPGEIVFLNTQEEAGSWSVLSSGGNLITKQTKVSENVYDMQCWNNSWTDKVQFDISEGSDFFECNDHVILIGSQAAVCTDETCQNGGTCAQDGLSFVCDCPIGFGGEFCEDQVSVGNCYDLDCSDFGGHKTELCTECTEANCCNYATRDLFNAHCDTLTSTADYVNAKCCHRTYCL
jgi:hypothetical protein